MNEIIIPNNKGEIEIIEYQRKQLYKQYKSFLTAYYKTREIQKKQKTEKTKNREKEQEEEEEENQEETWENKKNIKVRILNRQGSEREITQKLPKNNLNKNILIIGTSGTGKSELLRKIEEEEKPRLKILFKEDNEKAYRINKHRPYIKEDRTNFLEAWRESLKTNSIGYMLIQEQIQIQEIKKEGQTYEQMINEIKIQRQKASKLDIPVFNMIEDRLKHLYINKTRKIKNKGKISMQDMTEDEYLFFSDYILRLNYNNLLNEIISIDEIHRLKPLMEGLIAQITREIRSRGGIIATTQSLSDLPPELINNFASIYIFQDFDKRDLEYIQEIDEDLKEDVLKLENHEFLEIRSYKIQKKTGQRYKMELIIDDDREKKEQS